MSNDVRPEGWTDRMQPLPKDVGPAPVYGGDHGRMGDANQAAGQTVGQGQKSPQGASQTGTNRDPNEMTSGEKYWYDECMKSRKLYEQVAPLAPYVDVVNYLDSNPEAVELVVNHMQVKSQNQQFIDSQPKNSTYDTNVGPRSNMPVNQQNNAGGMQSMNNDVAAQLRERHMDLIKERGIPADEADRYIQFLINPGSLEPSELFDMYATLRNGRGNPVRSNGQPQNQNPNVQKDNRSSSYKEHPNEMPPMSVAGMNGGTTDPRKEQEVETKSRTRNVLDPNNV